MNHASLALCILSGIYTGHLLASAVVWLFREDMAVRNLFFALSTNAAALGGKTKSVPLKLTIDLLTSAAKGNRPQATKDFVAIVKYAHAQGLPAFVTNIEDDICEAADDIKARRAALATTAAKVAA